MGTKIKEYRYYPWKTEKYIALFCGVTMIALSVFVLITTTSKFEIGVSIFSILFFGLVFVISLKEVLSSNKKRNLSTSNPMYQIYRRYSKLKFIILSGGIISMSLLFINLTVLFFYNNSLKNVPIVAIGLVYITGTIFIGVYKLKKLQYIEKTGSPIYDFPENANTTES